jgi:hypothetical protein
VVNTQNNNPSSSSPPRDKIAENTKNIKIPSLSVPSLPSPQTSISYNIGIPLAFIGG